MNPVDPAFQILASVLTIVAALIGGRFLSQAKNVSPREILTQQTAGHANDAKQPVNKKSTGELRAANEATERVWRENYEALQRLLFENGKEIGKLEGRLTEMAQDCKDEIAKLVGRIQDMETRKPDAN